MNHINPEINNVIWLREFNIAVIYIPKTACTSWKLFLGRALDNQKINSDITYGDVHNKNVFFLPYIAQLESNERDEYVEKVKHGEINFTSIVREPKTRLLRAYLDKILLHKNKESIFSKKILPDIQKYIGIQTEIKPTLEEFLIWLRDNSNSYTKNEHWRPATELMGIKDIDYCLEAEYIRLWTMDKMDNAIGYFVKVKNRRQLRVVKNWRKISA